MREIQKTIKKQIEKVQLNARYISIANFYNDSIAFDDAIGTTGSRLASKGIYRW